MKKAKQTVQLPRKTAKQLQELLLNYQILNEYILRKMSERELINTNQIVEKYFVSRHTVYRFVKFGYLIPILKHRTLYFDAEHTAEFFANYWRRIN